MGWQGQDCVVEVMVYERGQGYLGGKPHRDGRNFSANTWHAEEDSLICSWREEEFKGIVLGESERNGI